MKEDVAGLMLTNPNTLGLFDSNIKDICKIVHEKGGLVYCDGANMNAMIGISRPAEQGYDVMHLNLHKTFATPHGSGGSRFRPVGVTEKLVPFCLSLWLKRKMILIILIIAQRIQSERCAHSTAILAFW